MGTSVSRAKTLRREARVSNMAPRHARVLTLAPKQVLLPTPTRKGAKLNKKPLTLMNPNKPFGEGISGVKNALQVWPTRRIFLGTIPIDIPAAELMVTSYSEGITAPKTLKVKFVKPSASSIPTVVPETLQVRETTSAPVPLKGKRILPFRSQSQSDSTSNGAESQVYSGPITRLRAKTLTYTELTLQSSATTFDQGQDQSEEQDEVTSPTFFDIRTFFQEEESPAVIPQVQVSNDDQAENVLVLMTSTPSLDEQM